jgi:two-component system C4-dicarboxylate transport response regulator DctD
MRRHLRGHAWPGNIRELRNFAFQVVLGMTDEVELDAAGERSTLPQRVSQFEAGAIEDALRATRGNVAAALPILGIPRKTFYDKVARLGINPADFRRKG